MYSCRFQTINRAGKRKSGLGNIDCHKKRVEITDRSEHSALLHATNATSKTTFTISIP